MPYFIIASEVLMPQTDLVYFRFMTASHSEFHIKWMAQLHSQPAAHTIAVIVPDDHQCETVNVVTRYIYFNPRRVFIHWCTAVHQIPNGLVAMISA